MNFEFRNYSKNCIYAEKTNITVNNSNFINELQEFSVNNLYLNG